MPAISPSRMLGLVVGAGGLVVMAGWLAREPALVALGLGQRAVAFNAGLGLALAGFGWMRVAGTDRTGRPADTAIAGLLLALNLAVLLEIVAGIDLGIDLAPLHRWLLGDAPHPGRVSAPTCVWFVLFGGFLLLFQARGRRWAALALEPLVFALILIGAIGIISTWLSIDDLYRWGRGPRMSLPTAIGITLLGIAAWLGLRADPRIQQLYAAREELILTILTGEILILMALAGGLGGFAALQRSLEASLSDQLRANLARRVLALESTLTETVQTAAIVSSRAALVRAAADLDAGPDAEASEALASSARGFLLLGYRHVAYLGRDGRRLAAAGESIDTGAGIRLELPGEARLGWSGAGFLLIQRTPMLRGNDTVGWLATEQDLPGLTAAYREGGDLGPLAEVGLCGRQAAQLACFPGPGGGAMQTRSADEAAAAPMRRALANEQGLARIVRDGEPIVVGFAPIGSFGLGLTLTVGLRDLYKPIRDELEHVLLLLLGLVLLGTGALSSQVTPLAHRLRRMATLDSLTGVLNRGTFMRLSEHALQTARRRDQAVSVVMLDADHFKKVNDTYGHDIGDDVLRALSATCRKGLRAVDILGRLGGEEFAITLPDTPLDGARLVAERLRTMIAALEVPTPKGVLRFTVSIGIAAYPGKATDVTGLLKGADEALYAAKSGGRNRVVLHDAPAARVPAA